LVGGLEECGGGGALVALGVDSGNAEAVEGGGVGGGVVKSGLGDGRGVQLGAWGGGVGCGVEGFAVEVVAGERSDEAGFVDGLPDEVDGKSLGRSAEVAGGGEAGGSGWGVDLQEGEVDGGGDVAAQLDGVSVELKRGAALGAVTVGCVRQGGGVEGAGLLGI